MRAVETVLAATVPFWWIETVRAFPAVSEIGRGQALAVALFAFLGAYAAVALLRALAAAHRAGLGAAFRRVSGQFVVFGFVDDALVLQLVQKFGHLVLLDGRLGGALFLRLDGLAEVQAPGEERKHGEARGGEAVARWMGSEHESCLLAEGGRARNPKAPAVAAERPGLCSDDVNLL